MTDNLFSAIESEPVRSASRDADSLAALSILGGDDTLRNPDAVSFSAHTVEVAAFGLALNGDDNATAACREAFELLRAVLQDKVSRSKLSVLEVSQIRTRAAVFGVLGNSYAQTKQMLNDATGMSSPPEISDLTISDLTISGTTGVNGTNGTIGATVEADDWGDATELVVHEVWQLLIRKRGWEDLDRLHQLVGHIRQQQAANEPSYLEHQADACDAWKLVAMYHLLRAAEIVAEYTEHGKVDSLFDPVEQAELHFDRASDAATAACDADLPFLVRLLDLAVRSMVEQSIWRIVRGAGTRATDFVERIASRDNAEPFLELLPPQHKALIDEGLIGAGRRSVVISLPTSAGKTLVAEFRILQALDSYEAQLGWVAYTAPTRALVNQLTARMRKDFSPLGIRVERFSPALEIDSVEAEILNASEDPFRVVVTTPEKLDLLLRGGWISDIGRPLSLVIVDEAHNLGSSGRGIKLELLLATINRESRDASFLLMTPFIPNAAEIASWLDSTSNQAVELGLEWLPNDRVVGLAKLEKAAPPRGDSRIVAETLVASAPSLQTDRTVELATGRPLGLSYSKLKSPTALATATAQALSQRGATVTLVGQPRYAWSVAERLADSLEDETQDSFQGSLDNEMQDSLIGSVYNLLAAEYGEDYPLAYLVKKGVAVHHAGLSDDVRMMVEALAERGALRHIVATVTLAQGINFPISNVVLGSHQYPYGVTMPTEDFWNIAGRAGRSNHGQPGVILLAAHNKEREAILKKYLASATEELNSTLITMVDAAMKKFGRLDLAKLSFIGEWSSFVQFITHTYRVVGVDEFSTRVEQILRGTLGFKELRTSRPLLADALVQSVQAYTLQLSGKPISLVDLTGFSWESVKATLARMSDNGIGERLFDKELFAERSVVLSDAIGVLLKVPELREQLVRRLDSTEFTGDFLSHVIKDWVEGMPLGDLADDYFTKTSDKKRRNHTQALTRCCQQLFGAILPTVSWGLSALQTLAIARQSATDRHSDGARQSNEENSDRSMPTCSPSDRALSDVPSYVYYGVNTREAVAFRLFGVQRTAALALAQMHVNKNCKTEELRQFLSSSSPSDWTDALGGDIGQSYYDTWRLTESRV